MLLYAIICYCYFFELDEMILDYTTMQWIHDCLLVKIAIEQGPIGLRILTLTKECELPNEFLYTFASQLISASTVKVHGGKILGTEAGNISVNAQGGSGKTSSKDDPK